MDYPGEKLLIKMWETLADKGIGSLLTPWHEKRVAEARSEIRRKEMLLLAQAEREVELINSGRSPYDFTSEVKLLDSLIEPAVDGRIEPILDMSDLAVSVAKRDFSEAIRKEKNIAQSVLIAEDVLSKDCQEPSDEPVDDDWIFSWSESAGRVSNVELQDLWGRILAGEIKQPGTYSMRTLEFLKGLSKSEAELISIAARFVVGDSIYRKKEVFLEKQGLYFSRLLQLQDIGVLSGVESIGLNASYSSMSSDKFFKPLVSSNKILVVEHDDPNRKAKAEVYLLTKVGVEVLKLASFEVDNEYIYSVAEDFVRQGFKATIGDWVQETANSGQLLNAKEVYIGSDQAMTSI